MRDCERFVCICEAVNLCDTIPGCMCAGLAAAKCSLVNVRGYQIHSSMCCRFAQRAHDSLPSL